MRNLEAAHRRDRGCRHGFQTAFVAAGGRGERPGGRDLARQAAGGHTRHRRAGGALSRRGDGDDRRRGRGLWRYRPRAAGAGRQPEVDRVPTGGAAGGLLPPGAGRERRGRHEHAGDLQRPHQRAHNGVRAGVRAGAARLRAEAAPAGLAPRLRGSRTCPTPRRLLWAWAASAPRRPGCVGSSA